jgi:hypothetical protein
LPIIVTITDVEQSLGVSKLPSGTGQAQVNAVISCLDDWELRSKVRGLNVDTTASIMGHQSGACVLIEQAIGNDMLHSACRNHMLEIVLQKVLIL